MNIENIKYTALTVEEYVKPKIEVIAIDNEEIVASSGGGGFYE